MARTGTNVLSGQIVKDRTVSGEVELDSNHYVNVSFDNATLIYRGGTPPTFKDCQFNQATFSFEGPAGNTIAFVNAMAPATTGMRDITFGLLPAMKG